MSIQMKNLSFKYESKEPYLFESFNYTINSGTILGILGESGSGKSTLLRLIAGLELPNSGEIFINDFKIVGNKTFIPPEEREVGMVFQDYALFPHMTVKKNILYGLKKHDFPKKRLKEVLTLVKMEGYEKRYPHELSGGQQQRIALARALAPEPKLLLLDEPFSSLDYALQLKIRTELKTILKKAKVTTILVTHNKENCRAIADDIINLKEGKIIQ